MKTKEELKLDAAVAELKLKVNKLNTLTKEIEKLKLDIIIMRADGFKLNDKPFLTKKVTEKINYEALVSHHNVSQTIINRYTKVVKTIDYKALIEQRELTILPEYVTKTETYAWYLKD